MQCRRARDALGVWYGELLTRVYSVLCRQYRTLEVPTAIAAAVSAEAVSAEAVAAVAVAAVAAAAAATKGLMNGHRVERRPQQQQQ